jgi:hypothetical protein
MLCNICRLKKPAVAEKHYTKDSHSYKADLNLQEVNTILENKAIICY